MKNLSCDEVKSMLSEYIQGKIKGEYKIYIIYHLQNCGNCYNHYLALKSALEILYEAEQKLKNIKLSSKSAPQTSVTCNLNLSAYIDNELSNEENIKIKKQIISNKTTRKNLEDIYSMKRLLQSSFDKTKNDFKEDFSKYILKKADIKTEILKREPLLEITSTFIILFVVATTFIIMFFKI